MNPGDVLLVVSLAFVLVGIVYALIAWRTGTGAGHVLEGIGLAALSGGLYAAGLLQLVWDLLAALVNWGRTSSWGPLTVGGVTGIGLAIVLWVVAGALNRRGVGVRTAEERASRRQERAAAKQDKAARRAEQKGAAGPSATPPSAADAAAGRAGTRQVAGRPAAPATGKGTPGQAEHEFDEIEEILKKRGIN